MAPAYWAREKTQRRRSWLVVRAAWLLLPFCGLWQPRAGAGEPSRAEVEFFEKDVRPLLVEKCWSCHGDAKRPKGGLRLTSRSSLLQGGDSGAAAIAGDPAASPLIAAIRYNHELKMPPKGKLPDREIDALTRWVALGVPWPVTKAATGKSAAEPSVSSLSDDRRHFWAFQPVKSVVVPLVRDAQWARTAIDRFVLAAIENKGLRPADAADQRTLIRRATFDLIGLPPTPEEVDDFLGDPSPQAFERVVDRLLASPQYGERWGRHWLDVVRYADARDLIQLPAESDFREAWRYRDWVVEAFNRDLPYPEFVRHQVAGDLLPPQGPGGINKDGLVATGLLAIADFVPGDVDKDQMIADYVNDQIDVVSRAFLGMSIACARCHDHKFDPISTEDYYALAGIFFSTRLIPGPVPGNTPLVRVALMSEDELARVKAREAADTRRRAELEQQLPDATDRAYVDLLRHLVADQTASYLVTAAECRQRKPGQASAPLAETARRRGLRRELLAGFVDYLDCVAAQPSINRHATLRDAAAGTIAGPTLEKDAGELQRDLAALADRRRKESACSSSDKAVAGSSLIRLRADDPYLLSDGDSRVVALAQSLGRSSRRQAARKGPRSGEGKCCHRWPSPAGAPVRRRVPARTAAHRADNRQPVCRLPARSHSQPQPAPVRLGRFRRRQAWTWTDARSRGQAARDRAEQWPVGRPGRRTSGPGFRARLHHLGFAGDDVAPQRGGGRLEQGGRWRLFRPEHRGAATGRTGSGNSPRYPGDIAELRVYNRQLDEPERLRVERNCVPRGSTPLAPQPPPSDPLAELSDELLSARGPFWVAAEVPQSDAPRPGAGKARRALRRARRLETRPPTPIPRAVVVQDGGPKGTPHEGFKDAQVFLRGNPHRAGKLVPRGVPRVYLARDSHRISISQGSGRRELADWLVQADNPLTARVMVNRIWQHHFGEGLVRTPNDFGARGEPPTNPELLDWLAARFVAVGLVVEDDAPPHHAVVGLPAEQPRRRPGPCPRPGQPPARHE